MKKLLLATTLLAGMGTMNVQASICNTSSDRVICNKLDDKINLVDSEDQRVVSGTIEGDYLILTTQDFDKDETSNKYVEINVSSLDQSQELVDLSNTIENETNSRKEADVNLQKQIDVTGEDVDTLQLQVQANGVENGSQQQEINKNTSVNTSQDVRMDGMDAFVQEQQLYNTSFSNSIKSNTNRINSLENKTEELTKGVAMAGAFAMGAGMHTLDHDNRWVIMPSLAHYEGETALAVQLQVAFTDHLSARFGYANSVSDMKDFDKGLVGGAVALSF